MRVSRYPARYAADAFGGNGGTGGAWGTAGGANGSPSGCSGDYDNAGATNGRTGLPRRLQP